MNLRLTPQALADAKAIKTWWHQNRSAVPDAFEQELNTALERILRTPGLGNIYEQGDLAVLVRRVLLSKTKNHVYYAIEGSDVVVLAIWGAPRGRGPRL